MAILPSDLLGGIEHGEAEEGSVARANGTRDRARPWFIALFVLAALARSLVSPDMLHWFDSAAVVARTALVLTLFLIGATLTRAQLSAVGVRPFVHGVVLWAIVASATNAVV